MILSRNVFASFSMSFAMVLAGCGGSVETQPTGGGGAGGNGTGAVGAGGNGTGATGAGGNGTGATGAGGQGTGGSGATGGVGGQGTGGAGGTAVNSGDCNTDADCPDSTCVEITKGGFRVCKVLYMAAETCGEPDMDECCNSTECDPGTQCLLSPLTPFCGGAFPLQYNVCASDTCASDSECPGGLCATGGTLGNKVASCVSASCHLDTDCKASAGGICAPIGNPCCGQYTSLHCVYPNGGCRTEADCKQDEYCSIEADGSAKCVKGNYPCPP